MKRNIIVKNYNISRNKVINMELTSVFFDDNETISMYKKYRFDEENTQKMINESQRISEEYDIRKIKKEYENKNCNAIYRRMSRLSFIDLVKEIFEMF